jgi:hypothetical protein
MHAFGQFFPARFLVPLFEDLGSDFSCDEQVGELAPLGFALEGHARDEPHLPCLQASNLREFGAMSKLLRGIAAGWGAKKAGGGCISTIIIFLLLWWLLGHFRIFQ